MLGGNSSYEVAGKVSEGHTWKEWGRTLGIEHLNRDVPGLKKKKKKGRGGAGGQQAEWIEWGVVGGGASELEGRQVHGEDVDSARMRWEPLLGCEQRMDMTWHVIMEADKCQHLQVSQQPADLGQLMV